MGKQALSPRGHNMEVLGAGVRVSSTSSVSYPRSTSQRQISLMLIHDDNEMQPSYVQVAFWSWNLKTKPIVRCIIEQLGCLILPEWIKRLSWLHVPLPALHMPM